jgi:hypothetical protein
VRSADFAAYTLRNTEFFGEPANPALIYRTAQVSFATPLTVQAEHAALPPLQPAATLTGTMEQVLAAFSSGVPCRIRLSAVYSYFVAPEFRTSLPILLALELSGPSAVPAHAIAAWHAGAAPPSGGAQLILSLTVSDANPDQALPIAAIGALPIDISAVPESWWT